MAPSSRSRPAATTRHSLRAASDTPELPSLDDLRLLVVAADSGSLSAAAERLGLRQPSVSWRLERMERRLGIELVVRTKRGVEFTRVGRLIVARGRKLLADWQQIGAAVRAESQDVRGRYSIGIYPALAAHVMPAFVPGLLTSYPDLELDIAHGISREISLGVIEFRHDLGIVVNPPRHPDLTIVELYTDEVRLWKATGARRTQFGPRVPLIYSPSMTFVEELLAQAREREVLDAVRHVHSSDLHVVARLAAAGAGIGVLPATIARAETGDALVSLRKSPTHHDRVALVWRHDAQQTHASKVIRDAIVNGVGQLRRVSV